MTVSLFALSSPPFEARNHEPHWPNESSSAWDEVLSRNGTQNSATGHTGAITRPNRREGALRPYAHDDTSVGTSTVASLHRRFLTFRRRNKTEAAQPLQVQLKSWFSTPNRSKSCQTPTSGYEDAPFSKSSPMTPPQESDDEFDWSETDEAFSSPGQIISPEFIEDLPGDSTPHYDSRTCSVHAEQSAWQPPNEATTPPHSQLGLGIFNADLADLNADLSCLDAELEDLRSDTPTPWQRVSSTACGQLPASNSNGEISTSISRREAIVKSVPEWLCLIVDDEDDDDDVLFLPKSHNASRASFSSVDLTRELQSSPLGRQHTFQPSSRRTQSSVSGATDDSFDGPAYPNPRIDRPFWIPAPSPGAMRPRTASRPTQSLTKRLRSPVIFEEVDVSDLGTFGGDDSDLSSHRRHCQHVRPSSYFEHASTTDDVSTSAAYAAKANREQRKSFDSFCSWSYMHGYMSSSTGSTPSLHQGSSTEEEMESSTSTSSPTCGFAFMLRPRLSLHSNDVFADDKLPRAGFGDDWESRLSLNKARHDSDFTLDKHAAFMANLRTSSSSISAQVDREERTAPAHLGPLPETPQRRRDWPENGDTDAGPTLPPSTPVQNGYDEWDEDPRMELDILAVETGESGWPQLKWTMQIPIRQVPPSHPGSLPGSPDSPSIISADPARYERMAGEEFFEEALQQGDGDASPDVTQRARAPTGLVSAFSSPDSLDSLPNSTPSFHPRPLLLRSSGHSTRDGSFTVPRPSPRDGGSPCSRRAQAETPSSVRAQARPSVSVRPLQLPALQSPGFTARPTSTARSHLPLPQTQLAARSRTSRCTYASSPLSIWPVKASAASASARRPSPVPGSSPLGGKAQTKPYQALGYNPRQAADVFGGPLYPFSQHTPDRRTTTTRTATTPLDAAPAGGADGEATRLAPPAQIRAQDASPSSPTLGGLGAHRVSPHSGTTLKHITGAAL